MEGKRNTSVHTETHIPSKNPTTQEKKWHHSTKPNLREIAAVIFSRMAE